VVGESGVSEEQGHRIVVSRALASETEREPLPMRALAATSWWGSQEQQWDWSVFRGDEIVASGWELSEVAALYEARHWLESGAEVGEPGDDAVPFPARSGARRSLWSGVVALALVAARVAVALAGGDSPGGSFGIVILLPVSVAVIALTAGLSARSASGLFAAALGVFSLAAPTLIVMVVFSLGPFAMIASGVDPATGVVLWTWVVIALLTAVTLLVDGVSSGRRRHPARQADEH
jgi:hypothetical protein